MWEWFEVSRGDLNFWRRQVKFYNRGYSNVVDAGGRYSDKGAFQIDEVILRFFIINQSRSPWAFQSNFDIINFEVNSSKESNFWRNLEAVAAGSSVENCLVAVVFRPLSKTLVYFHQTAKAYSRGSLRSWRTLLSHFVWATAYRIPNMMLYCWTNTIMKKVECGYHQQSTRSCTWE